ncbi:MAG: flavodoxin-dependent (E)-4-hydroxy-3-methylbut-2-enyl-diphosphate synthase [Planctomycetota bacterium]|jgi:(E)-4-hydroxy-3-methylbut-2-enyl-diphosphate synthase|nr:flavodoxin-dependent (E)-4-hydroxy-3-methylbut-2-enyl-diphosphate synthase [Planctomycetota bacterium]
MSASPPRRQTRAVNVGGVPIGGNSPLTVQSMTTARDAAGILAQIRACAERGGNFIRVALPALRDAPMFAAVVKESPLPVIADIHFDWRLALAALQAGAAKIRINPGNIDDWDGLRQVLSEAAARQVPIRIGVNSGSIKAADDARLSEALVAEALHYATRFEEYGFHDIVLSLKSSSVPETVAVNRAVAARCDYPLHLGVTEAGLPEDALLKSAVALGALLGDGIGDTLRVSFTGEPAEEIDAGWKILRAAGLCRDRPELISCPTCGRTRQPDLAALARELRGELAKIRRPLTVALMGCEVNGPGEAARADIGLAAAVNGFWLFVKGKKIRLLPRPTAIAELLAAMEQING